MSFTVDGTSGLTFPNSTTQASAGGMTLLGTLTTTSGTTQTLSGLTLTPYKFLQITVNAVTTSSAGGGALTFGGQSISEAFTSSSGNMYGGLSMSLDNGVYFGSFGLQGSVNRGCPGKTSYTTASTSIVFAWSDSSSFTGGTIKVYGIA